MTDAEIGRLADHLIREWDGWEAEACRVAQQEQDSAAGDDELRRSVFTVLRAYLIPPPTPMVYDLYPVTEV